ncbi:MAG TPA: redoxin domain-containing protein [Terriglobales bacterium]|nr:redoxin domain-containing protein [Terriglobales bacterium]
MASSKVQALRRSLLCGVLALIVCGNAPRASALNESRPDEAIKRGEEANAAGRYEDAIRAFKEANRLAHNSCYDCWAGMSLAYTRIGDRRAAEDCAEKVVRLAADAPQRARAHMLRGFVLMSFASDAKALSSAESEFRQALADYPNENVARFELGIVLLKQKRDEEGTKELSEYLAVAPSGTYADQARMLIADPRRARERFAPGFQLDTLQGERLSLNQLSGKIVVLDFWATWCPSCRAALPEIKELVKKYPREKLVLISVSADQNEQAWKDFVAKKGMDWPQCLDSDQKLRAAFQIRAFPTYLVIDGEGIVQQEIVGTDPQKSVAYRLKDTLKAMKQLN